MNLKPAAARNRETLESNVNQANASQEIASESIAQTSDAEAGPKSKLPFWKRPIFVLSIASVLFIGLRGFATARLLGGYYGLSSFLHDAAWAVAILIVLQIFDTLLTKGLTRLIGDSTTKRKLAIKVVRLGIIILLPGTFLLATVQMHPAKVGCLGTPADFEMKFAEHTIETADGLQISAWTIAATEANRPVVVMTHGLGANKQNFLVISQILHGLNYNVVTFDFRAHGDSEGHTCSLGVHEGKDVKAAYDLAKRTFPNQPVYCWSTSMGGAAALRAAAEHQIFDKLVVDATYSSVKSVAMDTKFCYLGPFGSSAWNLSRLWFVSYVGEDIEQYSPAKDIARLEHTPVFLIHGTADGIIPCEESSRLKEAAAEGTELWVVDGAGHSASFYHPDYKTRITKFVDGGN